jgi:hypothetical protein
LNAVLFTPKIYFANFTCIKIRPCLGESKYFL